MNSILVIASFGMRVRETYDRARLIENEAAKKFMLFFNAFMTIPALLTAYSIIKVKPDYDILAALSKLDVLVKISVF